MPKDQDHIERRAYRLWEEEGRPHGRADAHWQKAERELDGGAGAEPVAGASDANQQAAPTGDELETRTGQQMDDNLDDLGRSAIDPRRKAGARRKRGT